MATREYRLAHLQTAQAMVAAGDGGLSPSSLSDGNRLLLWLSNDGEGTDGSDGPRGSFRDGWLGTGGITLA
jgi:hypothetical protein